MYTDFKGRCFYFKTANELVHEYYTSEENILGEKVTEESTNNVTYYKYYRLSGQVVYMTKTEK